MIKAIRDLLEAIAPSGAPSGARTAEPVSPVVTAQPEPAGNVPRGKRRKAFFLGLALVALLFFFAFHRSQPVAPVVSHSAFAPRLQTTTLTPSEVTQSGQALQNDTNAVLAHSHEQAHNLAADQFNSDPANTGLPDPNREAKLRAENANLQTPGGGQGQSAANTDAASAAATAAASAADLKKEREALLQKSLHSNPYVLPTQMVGYQRPTSEGSTLKPAPDALATKEHVITDEAVTDTTQEAEDADDWSKYEGGLRRILAGTVLRGVLKNRIEGSYTGPAVIQIDDDVYTHDRSALVIKAGTILVGTATSVASQWQSRIDLQTNRVIMPDGFSKTLHNLPGLSQRGEMGISDKVNRHYGQIFGSALLIGAIGALGQIGNSTTGLGYDPSVSIRNGVTSSMGQTSERLLDKFSSRPPTITIREGTRVSLILQDDVLLPEYAKHVIKKDL